MRKTYPSQNLKQVLLRIPEGMRDALERAAKENGRSLTAEVLARIEATFPKDEPWLSQMQRSPVIRLEKRIMSAEKALQKQIDALQTRIEALEDR